MTGQRPGVWALVRAGALTSSALALGALGHVTAGGHRPDALVLAAVGAAVLAASVAVGRARAGTALHALLTTVVGLAGQLVVHVTATWAGTGHREPGAASGHHAPAALDVVVPPSGPPLPVSWPMVAAHGAAALATALALAFVDVAAATSRALLDAARLHVPGLPSAPPRTPAVGPARRWVRWARVLRAAPRAPPVALAA